MFSRETEGIEWLNSIWDEKGSEIKSERPHCRFSEWDQYGDNKACWFKASPQVCLLCLMGELVQVLVSIDEDLKDINKSLSRMEG